MTKKDNEIRKRDAIMTATQIINATKWNVVGHGMYQGTIIDPLLIPKTAKTMLVIYLNDA